MQETERQLIEAIRAGDREALRRLYEHFSRYAMGVTLRYVPRRDDALDIVQDSFISILTSISTFEYRGEGSLRNWVTRIVSNQAVSWMKDHEQLSFLEQHGIDHIVDMRTLKSKQDVDDKFRNLRTFEELSHKDVALKLGISEKAAITLFSRAKRKLAKMINEYLNSQGI